MNSHVPRYGLRTPASPTSSHAAAAIRRSKTTPEVLLARALRLLGIRYRPIKKQLPGRPDFVFQREKVAVFCDGDFWHGRNWPQRRAKLHAGSNADYWVAKIDYNRRRDRQNRRLLNEAGWTVIRLWESDILSDPTAAAARVARACQRQLWVSTLPVKKGKI
jgi:DNA mismatch endonuclease, patch repair protein